MAEDANNQSEEQSNTDATVNEDSVNQEAQETKGAKGEPSQSEAISRIVAKQLEAFKAEFLKDKPEDEADTEDDSKDAADDNALALQDLQAQLETAKATSATSIKNASALAQAGCVDIEIALGLLSEEVTIEKLQESKPYLFQSATVSTGTKPAGKGGSIPQTISEAIAQTKI